MNDIQFLPDEAALVTRALEALRASAGIDGEVLPTFNHRIDAAVMLKVHGRGLRYDCEIKKNVDRYSLLLDLINRPDAKEKCLLVTSSLSPDMANRCRELGIQFMDTAGNAYINDGEGVLIHITGRRMQERTGPTADTATITPAALRMMFAFLAAPSLLNAPYRDISYRAMVSTGAISKVFETLEARRMIGATADGKRMIYSPELFLNEWASGYLSRLKPKLKKYRFATDDLDRFRNWHPGLRLSAWSGEVGASYLTKHLQPEECTVYIRMDEPHTLRDLVKEFRLRADPAGSIEAVEMFWNSDYFAEWFPTVPPHLIYADLLATQDARNIAVAKQIATNVIEYVHNTSG